MSNTNPEFTTIDVPTPLTLDSVMPFGKLRDMTVREAIWDYPKYVRWFVNTIDRFELTKEAKRELVEVESFEGQDIPSDCPRGDLIDDDIPW